MYDYHVHSRFSGDCRYSMEDMVKGALEKNIKTLCFTDHIDYDYGDDKIDFIFDEYDYFSKLNKAKFNYRDQIEILSGIELGMQPHLVDSIQNKINLDNFDFIILSIHTVMGKEIHEGELFTNRNLIDAYLLYYSEMYKVLDNFSDFDVVGHINLIDRYVKYMDNKTIKLEEYKDHIEKVLKKIIDKDKGIEINTSGIRYGINSYLPTAEILKLYKKLGGETITIGSDAHTPEHIGFDYQEAVKLLRELNFKYLAIYKNRKKQFIKIE
ncbi:histidinol-phosphatase (PHP family) [Proteiniborus sp. DW1]|uniref:histidinol-phosphatase HisJ family protein n=1 Tax=Proteiniborus sp. DW1 TaxID=1889883 RepID=UPI00092E0DD8|nr:histidinol-phosphatase HisJ family protein [Proteiniborus sp. DW1]SCG83094.1 histidinol-phosphatase (PHP family) [Proteiniborus sp. DW1]